MGPKTTILKNVNFIDLYFSSYKITMYYDLNALERPVDIH